jgi:parallel beta-helix repeat protein
VDGRRAIDGGAPLSTHRSQLTGFLVASEVCGPLSQGCSGNSPDGQPRILRLGAAQGTINARIANNIIHDNADYGTHLYPDGGGSLIANNVIDGGGNLR